MEPINKLLDTASLIRKIPFTVLLSTLLLSIFLIALPTELAEKLNINEIIAKNGQIIGITLVVSIFLIIDRICTRIWKAYQLRRGMKAVKDYLRNLTPEEHGYLRPFIADNINTIYCDMTDGIVCGLEAKKIVYSVSSMGNMRDGFAYNLQPYAKDILNENPLYLNDAVGYPETRYRRRWGYF